MTSREALAMIADHTQVIICTDEYSLIRDDQLIHVYYGNKHARSYPLNSAPRLIWIFAGIPGYWTQRRYIYRANYDYMPAIEDLINAVATKLYQIDGPVEDLAAQYAARLESSMYDYFEPPPEGEDPPDILGETIDEWSYELREIIA